MESLKKEIPGDAIDKFCVKEFGALPKGNILPSEVYSKSDASLEDKFIEIAKTCFDKELTKYKAATMVCRLEMFL